MSRKHTDEIEPEIYTVPEYEDETLKYTDKANNGDILMLYSPTSYSERTYHHVREKSIEYIKEALSHTTYDGKNYFRFLSDKPEDINRIVNVVRMYHEQVLRQSLLLMIEHVIYLNIRS